MDRFSVLTLRALLVAGVALAIGACASVPRPASLAGEPETVVLTTGTRLPKTVDVDAPATTQPVTILTRKDLERSGAVSVSDALDRSKLRAVLNGMP